MHILGQTRAMEILAAALQSGRFHHGWIFSGPRGVGKFTVAIEVARALLDPESDGTIPARNPNSVIQKLIDSHTHPDLHIIRKEMAAYSDSRELRERKQLNIPVNLLRERIIGGYSGEVYHEAAAYRTSARGHGKVFIIDEAELLDETGQNAMLKTLEEPPIDTYFFLVTSQPDRLLATIRSRCQHVRFGRIDDDAMQQVLKRHGASLPDGEPEIQTLKSKIQNPSPELHWAIQFAEGSPGIALLALQYNFHQCQTTLDPMLADLERGRFPTNMGDALAGFVEEFAKSWVANHGTKTTSKDAANKDGAKHVFALLSTHARRRLAHALADSAARETWLHAIDLLREAERQLHSNVNVKMLMENLVVQWTQPSVLAA